MYKNIFWISLFLFFIISLDSTTSTAIPSTAISVSIPNPSDKDKPGFFDVNVYNPSTSNVTVTYVRIKSNDNAFNDVVEGAGASFPTTGWVHVDDTQIEWVGSEDVAPNNIKGFFSKPDSNKLDNNYTVNYTVTIDNVNFTTANYWSSSWNANYPFPVVAYNFLGTDGDGLLNPNYTTRSYVGERILYNISLGEDSGKEIVNGTNLTIVLPSELVNITYVPNSNWVLLEQDNATNTFILNSTIDIILGGIDSASMQFLADSTLQEGLYTINASLSGKTLDDGFGELNITSFSELGLEIDNFGCQLPVENDTALNLINDQRTNNTGDICFDFTGKSNIVLDCNGHRIVQNRQSYAFNVIDSINITIKNCEVIQNETLGKGVGLQVNNSFDITLQNTTMLLTGGNLNEIETGVSLWESSRVNIINNFINVSDSRVHAIFAMFANDSTIRDNRIVAFYNVASTTDNHGAFFFNRLENSTIDNNNLSVHSGQDGVQGIRFKFKGNNTISNNFINMSSDRGAGGASFQSAIMHDIDDDSRVVNNTIIFNSDFANTRALYFQGGSTDNVYLNNTIIFGPGVRSGTDDMDSIFVSGGGSSGNDFINTKIFVNSTGHFPAVATTGTNTNFTNLTFISNISTITFGKALTNSETIDETILILSNNSVRFDITSAPDFNVSSKIILHDVGTNNNPIYASNDVTFVDCDASKCGNSSVSGGTLRFDVVGFSNYSSNFTSDVTSCQPLVGPQTYNLINDINASTNNPCFEVLDTTNVILNCFGFNITMDDNSLIGISIRNSSGVTLNQCIFDMNDGQDLTGIKINQSSLVTINNTNAFVNATVPSTTITTTVRSLDSSGIEINNFTSSYLNTGINDETNIGFRFLNVNDSVINKINLSVFADPPGVVNSNASALAIINSHNLTFNHGNLFSIAELGQGARSTILIENSNNLTFENYTIRSQADNTGGNLHGAIRANIASSDITFVNSTIHSSIVGGFNDRAIFAPTGSNNWNFTNVNIISNGSVLTLGNVNDWGFKNVKLTLGNDNSTSGYFEMTSSTTNMSFVNLTLENSLIKNQGTVVYKSLNITNLASDLDFNTFKIRNGSIFLNSTAVPQFNSTANLTFFSPGDTALVDFNDGNGYQICSGSQCNFTAFTNGVFNMEVLSFTNYTGSNLSFIPINSCGGTITTPGNYFVTQDINSTGTCLKVLNTNDVNLSCQGFSINHSQASSGSAINWSNSNSGKISHCNIIKHSTVSNTKGLLLFQTNGITLINNTISISDSTGNFDYSLVVNATNNINSTFLRINSTQGGSVRYFGIDFMNVSNGRFTNTQIDALSNNGNQGQSLVRFGNFVDNITFNDFNGSFVETFNQDTNAIRFAGGNNISFNNFEINSTSLAILGGSSGNRVNFTNGMLHSNNSAGDVIRIVLSNNFIFNNVTMQTGKDGFDMTTSDGFKFQNVSLTTSRSDVNWLTNGAGTSDQITFNDTTFVNANGSVKFSDVFTGTGTPISLDNSIFKISPNSIFLDSTTATGSIFNVSSTLTMNNAFDAPTVDEKVNGTFEFCLSPRCTNISYANPVLTFSVSGFSNFSSNGSIIITAEDFPNSTIVGTSETFSINITISLGDKLINNATILFNDTANTFFTGSINTLTTGQPTKYQITTTDAIPDSLIGNHSWFWYTQLNDSSTFNSSVHLLEVKNFTVSANCTAPNIVLLNYTLRDEASKSFINTSQENTSVDVSLELTAFGQSSPFLTFAQNFTNINPVEVCVPPVVANGTFLLDVVTRYDADLHSAELHHIQNFTISNSTIPQNIDLFDLLDTSSTTFLITFKNNFLLPVEDVLIDIMRFYNGDGVFRSVEVPKTGVDGETLGHFVVDDAVFYKIIAKKNNTILRTFTEVNPVCDASGDCQINLNLLTAGNSSQSLTDAFNVSYSLSFNKSNRQIDAIVATTDGSVRTFELLVVKNDRLGNITACQTTLPTSSGTITCNIPTSIGNTSVFAKLSLSNTNNVLEQAIFSLGDNAKTVFGQDSGVMMGMMVFTLPLVFLASFVSVIFSVIIVLIVGTLLVLFNTNSVIGVTSSLTWLIISGGILIWKLASGGRD